MAVGQRTNDFGHGPPWYEIVMKARRVCVLCYDGVELLDVAGPVNVFTAATRLVTPGAYEVELIARAAGPVTTAGGVELVARRAARSVRGAIDTLLVPGGTKVLGPDTRALYPDLTRLARRARRVAGVCAGAFLMAEVGLLDGRRAVTHWAGCDQLARRYPRCKIERDAIFVRDDRIWTSAGVTAGIDLALALLEEDHGSGAALTVARWLVMYLRRPGGQSQFSAPLSAQVVEREPLARLFDWIAAHLREDLSVPALARRVSMSTRNFNRVFVTETGVTPAAWVQKVRLEAARTALETSRRSVKEIAAACGFGQAEALHRVFRRALGTTPLEYRERFSPRANPAPRYRPARSSPSRYASR
jgi:transcriptional regulator GlxA family with amidase domain